MRLEANIPTQSNIFPSVQGQKGGEKKGGEGRGGGRGGEGRKGREDINLKVTPYVNNSSKCPHIVFCFSRDYRQWELLIE